MKKTALRLTSLLVTIAMLAGYAPAFAYAAPSPSVSIATGNIEATVSTENGGFVIRTVEGDVITKDDNNKDLLYRRDRFDTSFTSFRVTEGTGPAAVTRDYVFGNDYSYLGLGGGSPVVARDGGRIVAVWSVDDLIFTQTLEPVVSLESSQHGTVKVSYSVENRKGNPVSVLVRILLDTALGDQDYAYYELAKSETSSEYDRIEKEKALDIATDFIPPSFFAYDDYENPGTAAYTIQDYSDGALRPYRIAFGHWNNLASTIFDFTPDGDLTFTNPYNKAYLTADSAFALYYDLGTVDAGSAGKPASIYYGVDSKVRIRESDRVGITTVYPASLGIDDAGDYVHSVDGGPDEVGYLTVQTNIVNLDRYGASKIERLKVAVLVDDGFTPEYIDGSPIDMDPSTPGVIDPPTNKNPYTVDIADLEVGEMKTITWRIKADVREETAYRRIIFRAYNMPDSAGGLLLLDNLVGSATATVLCPGGEGLPAITFTSAGPTVLYNKGRRHIFLTGTGFTVLNGSYQPFLYLKSDRSTFFPVPSSNIIYDEGGRPGVLEIVLTDQMPAGDYEMVFERLPGGGSDLAEKVTAPALGFLMTTDPTYRNDTYGVVAVVKEGSLPSFTYSIKAFQDEQAFRAFSGNVLLVFRGNFSITEQDPETGRILWCSAVSTSRKDSINVNGALDLEDGNVQIYRGGPGNDRLLVEFNGDLYTTNSHTSVWSGESSLTPLLDGADYGLISYNERGERVFGHQPQNIISIVWPWGYNMLQTIGGFAVDFRYGQFGAMYDNNDLDCFNPIGYVISFGGKLDLSFLMPGGSKQAEEVERDKDKSRSGSESKSAGDGGLKKDVVDYSPSETAKKENEKNKVEPAGKINVEDILFGNNKGFLGFNASAEIMLPKYFDALPPMGGRLAINTIGGYKVGVLGKVKTLKMDLEFELRVRNAPDEWYPVPDKLFFFMGGWEPGVNIDAMGGIWITGVGGGIDNLYDTIFKSGTIPLTLLLSADFDILKVMSGRADLALSLRGFQMKMSNVRLKNTDKVVINNGIINTQWSPDFYMQLSAWLDILGVIMGKTYLVVDDGLIEFFARADIRVPKDVKVVGGQTVANVDLGGNSNRLWGALSALGIKLGVTYYWGGDVSFGTGAHVANPTYPELLGYTDVPVGVAAGSGETLYMRVGGNLSPGIAAQVLDEITVDGATQNGLTLDGRDAGGPALPMLLGIDPSLRSDVLRIVHVLNLGDTSNDVAVTVTFKGGDRPVTPEEALAAVTVLKPGGDAYPLILWRNEEGADNSSANACFVDNEDTSASTLSFTITDYVAGDWSITTTQAADIVLYEVGELPDVTSFTAAMNAGTGKLDVSWAGNGLDETEIDIYVTPSVGDGAGDPGEIGYPVWSAGGIDSAGAPRPAPDTGGQSVSIDPPDGLPSGDYYVRMVISKEDAVNKTVIASGEGGTPTAYRFSFTNSKAPSAPASASMQNCGDNMFKVTVGGPPPSLDGYLVSLYEQVEGGGLVETDFIGIPFEKDEGGNLPEMKIGGTYVLYRGEGDSAEPVVYGLLAGKSYVAEVSAFNIDDGGTPEDPSDDLLIRSAEVGTAAVTLAEMSTPVIEWKAEPGSFRPVAKRVTGEDGTERTVFIDTFATSNVSFVLESDVPVAGYWSVDGSLSRDPLDPDDTGLHHVSNVTAVRVDNLEMCDGEHTIYFTGTDADGDSFSFTKVIGVDTTPPRLMLSSPVDGTFFETVDGPVRFYRVLIAGVGDSDARYTFMVDGDTVVDGQTLAELGVSLDPFGVFSYDLNLGPDDVSSHVVTIIAEDAVGNTVSSTVMVRNEALAREVRGLTLLRDGVACDDVDLVPDGSTTGTMQLKITPRSGPPFVVNDQTLVRWTATARQGSAGIEPDGTFTIEPGSAGYIEGEWLISDSASVKTLAMFGTEDSAPDRKTLTVNADPVEGGTATGAGPYYPGALVTLTATPSDGYEFDRWETASGGSFTDAGNPTTVFTMPADDAVVTAHFRRAAGTGPSDDSSSDDDAPSPVIFGQTYAFSGITVTMPLLGGFESAAATIVPYYLVDGGEVPVAFSRVVDGKLVFIAPTTTTFYAKSKAITFDDTQDHWARQSIDFAVARGLFNGVGEGQFDPDGQMTRAMFATVLARLDGADLSSYGSSGFSDVPSDQWYSRAVDWAARAGIVNGTGDGKFSPDEPITREQMAAMMIRYLNYSGFAPHATGGDTPSFTDVDLVSGWARNLMASAIHLGLVKGREDNTIDPWSSATRAECSTVFQRLIEAVLAGQV